MSDRTGSTAPLDRAEIVLARAERPRLAAIPGIGGVRADGRRAFVAVVRAGARSRFESAEIAAERRR